ncbi:unnamed protein product [Urochloa decumbens]|uniref:rRNA N-glycosylase n=1 Tax=Urochloa decumbens TaxID=240449 RepID=A0ABC9EQQ8_9POAL
MADQQEQFPDPPPAPDANNPMFQGAPAYPWHVSMDPVQMLTTYVALIHWIVNVVIYQRAAADNGGVPQVITQQTNGNQYSFGLTAETGFFRVVIIPSEELDEQQMPLHMMFSCRDLYLVGFLHDGKWKVFKDAKLDGSGHLQHPEAWESLGFKGSYIDTHFNSVLLGGLGLYRSYDCLVHYAHRSSQEIKAAVFRIIVVISEACRFPQWRTRVKYLLENWLAETTNHDRAFSELFKDWKTISKRARRGEARFEVLEGDAFQTFESLLQALHNGVANSRPPANQL